MENTKKSTIINILIITLTAEKMIQHLLTALFFIIKIPGIGTPDIGRNFNIDNQTMAILNSLYFSLFGLSLVGFIKRKIWGISLIISFAAFDILLEFLFHHFFFITVSVIMSTILTILSIHYLRIIHRDRYIA